MCFGTTSAPTRPVASVAPAVPGLHQPLVAAMPRMGDPVTLPEEGVVVMVTTPALEQQGAFLSSNTMLVWLGRRRPGVSAATIADAIASHLCINKVYFDVVPHYPKDLLITFRHHHHRDMATAALGSFLAGELDISLSNRSSRDHADALQLKHHVHLRLESVPLNAWNEEVVAKILDSAAVAHYFNAATMQKVDASSLDLWAWTANTSKIPKVMWLTIIGSSATGDNIVVSSSSPLPGFNNVTGSSSSAPRRGRAGLTYRVLVHVNLHEDFTNDSTSPCYENKFDISLGVVDGEAVVRDRQQPTNKVSCHDDNNRCRRDDNNERKRHDDNNRCRRDDNDERRCRDGGNDGERRGRGLRLPSLMGHPFLS
ncbi:hypothetical protein D1007_29162 [Hordeum vulgare]|nr:hypothetical protein D1007_29162 [Hordeum vulgare]